MNLLKLNKIFTTLFILTIFFISTAKAQQKPDEQPSQINNVEAKTLPEKPEVIKIYGAQLILVSAPDKKEISKAPVNNTGAGGFKVSKAGTYIVKATFGKKIESETIKELKIDIKYPDGTRKTFATTPASNGKSIESAEFEWMDPAKPLFAYLTSTQGKVNTLAMSEVKK